MHDVFAVHDVMFEQLLERENLRFERNRTIRPRGARRHEREHVVAKARLQRRMFVELVEHDLRRRVALQLDHDPHSFSVGLVVQRRYALNLLIRVSFGDRFHDAPAVHLIRNL